MLKPERWIAVAALATMNLLEDSGQTAQGLHEADLAIVEDLYDKLGEFLGRSGGEPAQQQQQQQQPGQPRPGGRQLQEALGPQAKQQQRGGAGASQQQQEEEEEEEAQTPKRATRGATPRRGGR